MLRLWLAMGVGVACLLISGVIGSMARAQPSSDPAAIITAYEMARNKHDVDTALSFFADDAVISQRSTNYSGKDEIRKFLDAVAARGRYIVVSDRQVSGTHVMWTERSGGSSTDQPRPPQAYGGGLMSPTAFSVTVEAVVQDGKIQSLSYMFGGQSTRTDPTLEGRAQLPASFGMALVLAVMLPVLLIASTGIQRGARASSTLRGRLLQDLRGWSAARH